MLWGLAFSEVEEGGIEWFVSEYDLPVPPEWRGEIPFTYRCPDFACCSAGRILVVELKTEVGSYNYKQMADYLRLSRRKHPGAWVDVVLLGPMAGGFQPPRDGRQRYGELTWQAIPALLADVFPDIETAANLHSFLELDLARPSQLPQFPGAEPVGVLSAASSVSAASTDAEATAAVEHALRMAPAIAAARPGDQVDRGIDVAFSSVEAARVAQRTVKRALNDAGYSVGVWLWQPSSAGVPATPAGNTTGLELRLAPKQG